MLEFKLYFSNQPSENNLPPAAKPRPLAATRRAAKQPPALRACRFAAVQLLNKKLVNLGSLFTFLDLVRLIIEWRCAPIIILKGAQRH